MTARPPGPLFASLTDSAVEQSLSAFQPRSYEAGEVVLQTGTVDPSMLVITSGVVDVLRDGAIIDSSAFGETLGEMSFFTGKPRVATAIARGPVTALEIDRQGYKHLRANVADAADELERLVLTRLGHRVRRLDALIAATAPGEANPYAVNAGVLDRIRALIFGADVPAVAPGPRFGVEILHKALLFREAGEEAISALGAAMTLKAAPKGTFLSTQGTAGGGLFVVASGRVDVFVAIGDGSKIHRLASLEPPDAFGMTALVSDGARLTSYVTSEKTDYLELPLKAWRGFLYGRHARDSALRCAVIRGLAAQLDDAARSMLALPNALDRLTAAVKWDMS